MSLLRLLWEVREIWGGISDGVKLEPPLGVTGEGEHSFHSL